jgi:hypothetical protein
LTIQQVGAQHRAESMMEKEKMLDPVVDKKDSESSQ